MSKNKEQRASALSAASAENGLPLLDEDEEDDDVEETVSEL